MRAPIRLCLPILVGYLLAVAAGAAAAQTQTATIPQAGPTVTGVTVTNVGTYSGQSISAPSSAGQSSPTGTIGTQAFWRFVSSGQDVAAKVGTQFGIEFRLDGAPAGEAVTLYLVLNFPPQG